MREKLFKNGSTLLGGAIIILVILFPFYWLLVTSLKVPEEIFKTPPSLFPQRMVLDSFNEVYKNTPILRYFLNSIFVSAMTVFLVISIASMAAYAMSRYVFKGKKMLFIIILLSQMLPLTTVIIPLYMFWSKLGQTDSYISLILSYSGFSIPIAIWLLTGYFAGIPKSIDQAAKIDGCSSFMILVKIILPLAKPGLMAASITIAITAWQELMLAMTFTTSDSMRTLPAGISTFITSQGIMWGPLTAAGVITTIPIVLVFIGAQKFLISGLTTGATKG